MPLDPTLLIVSSDRGSLDLLAGQFIGLGYSITPVHHPRQALEAATFKPFDVAIVQDNLPELSGLQLARRLQRLVGDVRVILLSSMLTKRFEANARRAGVYACLATTCPPEQIERTVENAIADHSLIVTRFTGSSTKGDRMHAVTN